MTSSRAPSDEPLRAVTAVNAAMFVGWFGLPILCAMALMFVGSRYILQESGGVLWGLCTGVLWLAVALLIPGLGTALLPSPKVALAFVFWAAVAGWYAGLLAIRVVNCAGDRSEALPAKIAKVDGSIRGMTVVTIGEPYPGTVFECPKEAWLSGEAAGKRFFVHRGRLGLLWGEFL